MEDNKRKVEEPKPEFTFKEGALNQFFSNPVWKSIEELLSAQEQIAMLHLTSPDIDDVKDIMFFKGIINHIEYMKNIKQILMED